MSTESRTITAELHSLGVELPVEFLHRLGVEEYLDEVGTQLGITEGQRDRLHEMLATAGHESAGRFVQTTSAQQMSKPEPGETPIDKAAPTPREVDLVLEFRRRRAEATLSGHPALGNILVANRQISRTQLEAALTRQVESGRRLGEELVIAGHASTSQVKTGLSLQRKLVAFALALATGLAPLPGLLPGAEAGQSAGTLAVSVRVIAEAKLQTSHQASRLDVSAADVARGYVEVAAASRFSVSTDSLFGYTLEFHSVGHVFDAVQVVGLGRAVRMGADGGTVFVRGPLTSSASHELNYRFSLSPDTLPGAYAWPLLLSVHALP